MTDQAPRADKGIKTVTGQPTHLGLQDALPEVGDHEEELQGGGHVAGGAQVLDSAVARLASPVVLWPVLKGVGLVRL